MRFSPFQKKKYTFRYLIVNITNISHFDFLLNYMSNKN